MARDITGSVVVITGASSGIGKATALAFAREGARLVLAARREHALGYTAEETEGIGAETLVVPTDVSDEAQVGKLAERTLGRFGRIDTWINNAGVSMFARFEEAPPDTFRQVLETNLFGYIYGARAAIPHFREQGSGVLINNSSVLGRMGAPYLSAYVTSKWAIRGLGESLREELMDAPDVHVATVLPPSIDTPIFQNAANYTGRKVKPMEPVLDADEVAQAMVRLARRPRRELVVGRAGTAQTLFRTIAPAVAERMAARRVGRDHFEDRAAPYSSGNVTDADSRWTTVEGYWRQAGSSSRVGKLIPLLGLVAVAAAAAAGRALR